MFLEIETFDPKFTFIQTLGTKTAMSQTFNTKIAIFSFLILLHVVTRDHSQLSFSSLDPTPPLYPSPNKPSVFISPL